MSRSEGTATRHDIHESKLMLHEAISKKFDRTPSGAIFTKDLKNIFSLTMICLNLQEKPEKSNKAVSFLNKHSPPFTFSLQEAIDIMADLSLSVESTSTSTTVSYSIKSELASSLLKKFMTAKLIHTPADRTRSEPKSKVLLQPTPKGVSVIQSYCKFLGFKNSNLPSILNSSFNSMDLFLFERSAVTDTVVFSEYFVHLLFIRFLGEEPNVWRATNPPDPIPSLDQRLENDDEFDFSNFQNEAFIYTPPQLQQQNNNNNNSNNNKNASQPHASSSLKNSILPILNKKQKVRESPFAHNFFTNPESDSHVQYYVSNKGVRLYKNHKFGDKQSINIEYSFNAKAAWQWLMDCTDIMYPQEATNVLNLFYKYGLISPIILSPSTASSKRKISPSKTAFYTLSKTGWDVSHWNQVKKNVIMANDEELFNGNDSLVLSNQAVSAGSDVSSDEEKPFKSTEEQLTLKKVLADPGMRYLFRNHLEKEFCAENLDVYLSIKHFSKKMTILKNVIEIQKEEELKCSDKWKSATRSTVVRLINECLSSAYNVYSSYITVGAPYQLNIDHSLREKITDTMIHPSSPLRSSSMKEFQDAGPNSHLHQSPSRHQTLTPPQAVYFPGKSPIIEQNHILTASTQSSSGLNPTTSRKTTTTGRTLNNKNLSIDVSDQSSTNITNEKIQTPKTPTQAELSQSLLLLHKLYPLFEMVGKHILKLMEFDSFPKFLSSETFSQANR